MIEYIKDYLIKDKYIILISILLGLIFTLVFTVATKAYSYNIQKSIADEVIRFHVLANSNSEEDQALKLKVRDAVIEELKDALSASSSKLETKKMLNENIDRIIELSKDVIKENGYDYNVTASIYENDWFPTKEYGDIKLPAGNYDSLRIIIGSGKGNNWWCVMFPPLCFVDVTFKEIPEKDKETLKEILTDEEYDLISKDAELPVKVKFKIVEFWQNK